MAIEKEIKIKVDTKDAEKSVGKLNDGVQEVGESAKESGDKASKGINKVEKSSKGASKASRLLSKGVKGIGLALKAAGIGIALAVFAKLVQVLTSNQKVADGLSVVFGTISNVLTSVVGAVADAVSAVSQARGGFESLGNVLSGLFTLALTPLKGAFFAIKLGLQEAQLAWEQSFFGDDDPETVKRLNESIKQTRLDLVEVGMDAVKAGKDVATNFSGAIDELGALANEGINNLSKVSLKASFEQAKASTELGKAAILAEASLQGLIEKYDRQAEQQRQIRDDDQKSIADRIKANEELGRILDEQNKEQVKLAKVRVSQAQDELKKNKDNVDAQRALIEAQNEVLAIEAQVEGFRSEQLINRNSLLREQKDIVKELNEIGKTEAERVKQEAKDLLEERRAKIELQISDEVEKFRLLAEARKDYEDTIAELDAAEQVRIDKIAELGKSEVEIAREKAAELRDQRIAEIEELVEDEEEKFRLLEIVNRKYKEKILDIDEKASEKQKDYDRIVAENKKALIIDGLAIVQSELKRGSAVSKGIAAAQTIFDTQQGIMSALSAKGGDTLLPFPVRLANSALVGIKGALALKNILKTNPISAAGGTAQNNAGAGGTQAPAFNLTASSGVNQIAGDVQGSQPLRAFVVGSDVTNQQQMDRDTFGQAGLG